MKSRKSFQATTKEEETLAMVSAPQINRTLNGTLSYKKSSVPQGYSEYEEDSISNFDEELLDDEDYQDPELLFHGPYGSVNQAGRKMYVIPQSQNCSISCC
jgi:hypothetical protein